MLIEDGYPYPLKSSGKSFKRQHSSGASSTKTPFKYTRSSSPVQTTSRQQEETSSTSIAASPKSTTASAESALVGKGSIGMSAFSTAADVYSQAELTQTSRSETDKTTTVAGVSDESGTSMAGKLLRSFHIIYLI